MEDVTLSPAFASFFFPTDACLPRLRKIRPWTSACIPGSDLIRSLSTAYCAYDEMQEGRIRCFYLVWRLRKWSWSEVESCLRQTTNRWAGDQRSHI